MTAYTPDDAVPIQLLREAFGDEVMLEGEEGDSKPLRILAEFRIEDRQYAVLQSAAMKRSDELALFHIVTDEQGELQLATVEDDDEWEAVLELYDEMTVLFD
ncbi:MAG: hypothetical protein K0R57_3948 [Paenibacillaceae bacterium]|nr:hypothetical protein [Paenibacillaceae bacterium]